jgi:sodium/bile acid cotransporter 7
VPLQQLGGNVSLALLLTVSSNILGIFTMPFILPHILAAAPAAAAGASSGLSAGAAVLQPVPLLLQLCKTILVPTLVGAAIRGFLPGVCFLCAEGGVRWSPENVAF